MAIDVVQIGSFVLRIRPTYADACGTFLGTRGPLFSAVPFAKNVLCSIFAGALCLLERPPHALCNELGERTRICINARAVQGAQIFRTILNANHSPWIPARRQQNIHQKPCHTAIAIGIRMNVAKEPMTEHSSNRRLRFCFNQIEQCRHRVAHRFPTWRNISGISQIDSIVAIASQGRGRD